MKKNWYAYNFGMRKEAELVGKAVLSIALLLTTCVAAQQTQSANEPVITTKELPVAGLWDFYSVRVETEGTQALTWRAVNGSLPHNLELHEFGRIDGVVNEQGTFEVEIVATGQGGARSKPKRFKLEVERPLKTDWSLKSQVNGSRIEGSIKVSNTTGRDFDLTFVVLAVNDIGRATAIGYQHFPLKRNTRDMELPFGDTLSPGSYVVNIDVVGEEPNSGMIFRTRLLAPKQTIAQGP